MSGYGILIVSPHLAFEAETARGDCVVFVDLWATREDEWYIIKCKTEEDRARTLELLKNREGMKLEFDRGFLDGWRKGEGLLPRING